jgi:C-terminal processing protease CtpA/Prc
MALNLSRSAGVGMFLKVCERGLEITEILPNGPLTRLKCAGKVRVGDILTKVDGKVVGDLNSAMEALNGLQGTAVILTVLRYSLVGVPDTISVCVVRGGSDMKREETPARMQGRRDEVALDSSLGQRTQEQSMRQILEQAQGITSCADPTSSARLHAALSRAEAAEAQLVNLQGHFNALLQVLSRRCLNNRD